MQFLITRPISVSKSLTAKLEAEGHTVVSSPLLEIRPVDRKSLDLKGVQALIVTSINGLDNLLPLIQNRSLPIYCVGNKTAEAAILGGFETVKSADGNIDDLAKLIQNSVDPTQGVLLHVGGKRLAGDLQGVLEKAGYFYRREILYDAAKVEGFTSEALDAFRHGKLQGVLLFSPYTAEVFCELVQSAGLQSQLAHMDAWCLSENVANRLDGLGFHGIHVASQPKEKSLLNLINEKIGQSAQQREAEQKGTREHTVSEKSNTGDKDPQVKKDTEKSSVDSKSASKTAVPPSDAAKSTSSSGSSSKVTNGSPSSPKGSATTPVSEKKSGGSRVLWTLVGLFFVFCLGMAAWPLLYPSVSKYLPEETRAILSGQGSSNELEKVLAQRLSELDQKIAALPKTTEVVVPENVTAALAEIPLLKDEVNSLKSQTSNAPEGLEDRLDTLEMRLQELDVAVKGVQENVASISLMGSGGETEGEVPANAAAVAELTALRSALENLTGQIRSLKEEQAASITDLASQKSQLETLSAALEETVKESRSSEVNSGDALSLLALGQLQRKSQTAQPFDGAWQQAMAVLPAKLQPDLALLSDVAKTGAPTYRDLTEGFGSLATDAVQASRLPESETWYGKTLHNLASLVKFRRVDGAEADSVDFQVTKAEMALFDGDLATAVNVVKGLQGEPAKVMASWLKGAEARLLVDKSLGDLISKASTAALDKTGNEN
ncbi:uroporphyrinogen-III synthase [Sneathiella limimaris]|uniref:uroporphyrinogen-III synthase n=1 Tax=Sneathiella limimaris TaxID=1964213 RepID=UPI00146A2F06|nr:uroporphyrinogen-III synthase [Sneathiella limimaris]